MAKKTLTPTYLDSLKCPKGRLDVFDALTPGLHIRVTTDRKTWAFTFTPPGAARTVRTRIALGTYPATTLLEARTRAVDAKGLVEAGKDPRDAAKATKPMTMAQLAAERLEMEIKGKMRTAAMIEWRYNKYILAHVGNVLVEDFRIDPHYRLCVNPLKKANKLRMAGIVHTDLVALMTYACSQGIIEYSRLKAAENPDPKNVRKRNLSPVEIPLFWNALPKALVRTKTVQRILKLCLITGQRVGEVCGMKKAELDLLANSPIWTLPAARVKNGDAYGDHIVPLSTLALDIIREAMRAAPGDYLFPNEAGDGPLDAEVVARTLKRAFDAGDFAIPAITPHDLRRTVGTQMLNRANGLKITKHEKYLVLNHQSALNANVSDEVYDQNEYTDEKREALDKWGAFLSQLVAPEPMRMAAE